MSTQTLPILYSFRRCPYAMRARMTLIQAGVQCELREVDLKAKPAQLLDVSPKGTVPVLVLTDGRVIDESLDVMRWALQQADQDLWGQHLDVDAEQMYFKAFLPALNRYKYPDRFADEGVSDEQRRVVVEEFLYDLDQRLAKKGFMVAERITFSDIAIFPFIRQCRLVDSDWFDALPYAHIHRWLTHIFQLDCYEQAMVKHKPWQPGQDSVTLMQAERV